MTIAGRTISVATMHANLINSEDIAKSRPGLVKQGQHACRDSTREENNLPKSAPIAKDELARVEDVWVDLPIDCQEPFRSKYMRIRKNGGVMEDGAEIGMLEPLLKIFRICYRTEGW